MAGHSEAPTQPAAAAPVQQMEQPAAASEPTPIQTTAAQQPVTTNTEYISQEPPAYNETVEKGQVPSSHPAPTAAHNQQSQGRMVTPLERLGEEPALVDCPYCKRQTTTRVGQEHSTMTVLAGFLLGCICICLACVPCITHACSDVDQYCSNCNKKLTHKPYDKPVQVVAVRDAEMQVSKYPASQQVPSEQPGHVTQ